MSEAPSDRAQEDLDLILFRVGGVRFGVQAAQVLSALSVAALGAKELVWFQDLVGMSEGSAQPSSVALELRGESLHIAVDYLESLVQRPLSGLRPLPALIEAKVLENGFWAALPEEPGMVLLVDLLQLVRTRSATSVTTSPL